MRWKSGGRAGGRKKIYFLFLCKANGWWELICGGEYVRRRTGGGQKDSRGRRTKNNGGGPRCHQEHFCKGEAQKIFGRLGKRGQPRKARGRGNNKIHAGKREGKSGVM